jgi:hypothetical protein
MKNILLYFIAIIAIVSCAISITCPVKIVNDTTMNIWVISIEQTRSLKDLATDDQIQHVIATSGISTGAKKLLKNQAAFIEYPESSTYFIYAQVKNTQQFARLYQLSIKQCIYETTWWNNNTLYFSAIVGNTLTETQKNAVAITKINNKDLAQLDARMQALENTLIPSFSDEPRNRMIIFPEE